jgi:CheY-like chemotaxis protein
MSSIPPKRPSFVPSVPPASPASRPPPAPSSASRPPPARPSAPVVSPSVRPSNIREAAAEAHAIGGGAVVRASAAPAAMLRKTILIVDPDPALRARLKALLQAQYDVIEAKDGLEAIELTRADHPPALIVSDTAMPRLDGFSMAKVVRGNPLTKRVPIIFVSAQHSPQHVTQALVIGVSQYLPRTTPVEQIVDKIRRIAQ